VRAGEPRCNPVQVGLDTLETSLHIGPVDHLALNHVSGLVRILVLRLLHSFRDKRLAAEE